MYTPSAKIIINGLTKTLPNNKFSKNYKITKAGPL